MAEKGPSHTPIEKNQQNQNNFNSERRYRSRMNNYYLFSPVEEPLNETQQKEYVTLSEEQNYNIQIEIFPGKPGSQNIEEIPTKKLELEKSLFSLNEDRILIEKEYTENLKKSPSIDKDEKNLTKQYYLFLEESYLKEAKLLPKGIDKSISKTLAKEQKYRAQHLDHLLRYNEQIPPDFKEYYLSFEMKHRAEEQYYRAQIMMLPEGPEKKKARKLEKQHKHNALEHYYQVKTEELSIGPEKEKAQELAKKHQYLASEQYYRALLITLPKRAEKEKTITLIQEHKHRSIKQYYLLKTYELPKGPKKEKAKILEKKHHHLALEQYHLTKTFTEGSEKEKHKKLAQAHKHLAQNQCHLLTEQVYLIQNKIYLAKEQKHLAEEQKTLAEEQKHLAQEQHHLAKAEYYREYAKTLPEGPEKEKNEKLANKHHYLSREQYHLSEIKTYSENSGEHQHRATKHSHLANAATLPEGEEKEDTLNLALKESLHANWQYHIAMEKNYRSKIDTSQEGLNLIQIKMQAENQHHLANVQHHLINANTSEEEQNRKNLINQAVAETYLAEEQHHLANSRSDEAAKSNMLATLALEETDLSNFKDDKAIKHQLAATKYKLMSKIAKTQKERTELVELAKKEEELAKKEDI